MCLCLIHVITIGFGHIGTTCYFSPECCKKGKHAAFGKQCLNAGSDFIFLSQLATHQLPLLADSSLTALIIDLGNTELVM